MGKHVKDRDRFSIIQKNMSMCFICKGPATEKHEIFYGTAYRTKSKDWGMVVGLCHICHMNIHDNQRNDEALKRIGQRAFEARYGHAKYMEVFRKNYLEEGEWNTDDDIQR